MPGGIGDVAAGRVAGGAGHRGGAGGGVASREDLSGGGGGGCVEGANTPSLTKQESCAELRARLHRLEREAAGAKAEDAKWRDAIRVAMGCVR